MTRKIANRRKTWDVTKSSHFDDTSDKRVELYEQTLSYQCLVYMSVSIYHWVPTEIWILSRVVRFCQLLVFFVKIPSGCYDY